MLFKVEKWRKENPEFFCCCCCYYYCVIYTISYIRWKKIYIFRIKTQKKHAFVKLTRLPDWLTDWFSRVHTHTQLFFLSFSIKKFFQFYDGFVAKPKMMNSHRRKIQDYLFCDGCLFARATSKTQKKIKLFNAVIHLKFCKKIHCLYLKLAKKRRNNELILRSHSTKNVSDLCVMQKQP